MSHLVVSTLCCCYYDCGEEEGCRKQVPVEEVPVLGMVGRRKLVVEVDDVVAAAVEELLLGMELVATPSADVLLLLIS